jgi:hypothetical protein
MKKYPFVAPCKTDQRGISWIEQHDRRVGELVGQRIGSYTFYGYTGGRLGLNK